MPSLEEGFSLVRPQRSQKGIPLDFTRSLLVPFAMVVKDVLLPLVARSS